MTRDEYWNRPCAGSGLTSYRYKGPFGFIMIGAKDVKGALYEASRSTGKPTAVTNLEVWNGTEYAQAANHAPGKYYVSAMNTEGNYHKIIGERVWWPMVGPLDDHATALALVDAVRSMACEMSPKGVWMAYGTIGWFGDGDPPKGKLNKYFGL